MMKLKITSDIIYQITWRRYGCDNILWCSSSLPSKEKRIEPGTTAGRNVSDWGEGGLQSDMIR